MKRRQRIGRAVVFAVIVICFYAGAAGGLTSATAGRGSCDAREAMVHDVTIEAKDLLLRAIHLGQRILVTASKRYAALTEAEAGGTFREGPGGTAS